MLKYTQSYCIDSEVKQQQWLEQRVKEHLDPRK